MQDALNTQTQYACLLWGLYVKLCGNEPTDDSVAGVRMRSVT